MSMQDLDTWMKTLADGKTYVGPFEAFDDDEWSVIAYPDGSTLWMFAVPAQRRGVQGPGSRDQRSAESAYTARPAKAARRQRLHLPGDHGRTHP